MDTTKHLVFKFSGLWYGQCVLCKKSQHGSSQRTAMLMLELHVHRDHVLTLPKVPATF